MTDPSQNITSPPADATVAPVPAPSQAQPSAPSFEQIAAEVSAPQQPVEQTPTEDLVVAWAKEKGLDLQGRSGREVLDTMLDEYTTLGKQFQQTQPYANEYFQHRERFQEWLNSQQQPQQPAAQPEAKKPAWEAPEFNPQWESLVKRDADTGRFVPANQYISPAIADKVNAYYDWFRNSQQELLRNPVETLKKAGLEDLVEQKIAAARQEWENQQYIQQRQIESQRAMEQDAQWMFQFNQNGHVLRDGMNRPVLTYAGQLALGFQKEAESMGIVDPVHQHSYARDKVAALQYQWELNEAKKNLQPYEQGQQPQEVANQERARDPQTGRFLPQQSQPQMQPQMTPQQQAEMNKQNYIDQARTVPRTPTASNRNQSIATAAMAQVAQNDSLDFSELMREEIALRGGKTDF